MSIKFSLLYIIVFFLILSCSKNAEKATLLKEKNLETQMIEVYNQGMKEFEKGDVIYAGRKFSEAELLFPQSVWAPRAVLMSAYGYFSQGYYANAINDLERFIVKYKNHKNLDYAYYLLALCHYDQIVDEKKDLNEISLRMVTKIADLRKMSDDWKKLARVTCMKRGSQPSYAGTQGGIS